MVCTGKGLPGKASEPFPHMLAAILDAPQTRLRIAQMPTPSPGAGQVLVRVSACGVCRTDLHVVDGELDRPALPLVPGHEIIGIVEATGPNGSTATGTRVGIPWLGWTCGTCRYCRSDRENLCDAARFTGYTLDGGFAEYVVADERYCFKLPDGFDDAHAAPLMCAGLIGYRSLVMAGDAQRIGIYGFGAAAHIVAQVAAHQGRRVFAFVRPGDDQGLSFALEIGVTWAGASDAAPPEELDAAIVFAPAGELVPAALRAVSKGGTVVCGGIHMSDVPSFPYATLWGERVLRSVANLTRRDAQEFLELAASVPIKTRVETFGLSRAGDALDALRSGRVKGAAVLIP
jgi:propanol-preferring alcohol dehydrogenase